MSKIFSISAVSIAGLASVAFLGVAQPAAAKDYGFCRNDYPAGMRQCAFDTLEQCRASANGRGGDCIRNPSVEEGAAYAYAPRAHNHSK